MSPSGSVTASHRRVTLVGPSPVWLSVGSTRAGAGGGVFSRNHRDATGPQRRPSDTRASMRDAAPPAANPVAAGAAFTPTRGDWNGAKGATTSGRATPTYPASTIRRPTRSSATAFGATATYARTWPAPEGG